MAFAGRRVLVVEDEYLVSLATTDLLESVGCVILGPEALLAKAVRLAQSEREIAISVPERKKPGMAGLQPFADPQYGNRGPREEQQD